MTQAYYYECTGCGKRMLAVSSGRLCPACGSPLQNLALPRE